MSFKCTTCGALCDDGQLKCEYCGAELTRRGDEQSPSAQALGEADIITRKVIEKVQKCVLKICTATSTGTGFVTRDGLVVSNAHVVVAEGEAAKMLARLTGGGIYANFYGSDERHPLKILSFDEREDVAVLAFADGAESEEYLELADSDGVKMGERIFTIGNPLGYEFSYAEGTVGSPYRKFGDRKNPVLQMQLAVNPGNSGGPVCNSRGEVVGIASFFRFNKASWSHQVEKDDGISFAVTAKTIGKEIKKAGK